MLLTGFGCKPTPQELADVQNINLTYWQVWNNSVEMQPLIDEYTKLYPNVQISFRSLRFEEYEQELLKAWAEDRGPDLFSLPHDWLPLYANVIVPSPASAKIQRVIMREPGIGELAASVQNVYTEEVTLLTSADIKRNYYAFVRDDVLSTVDLEAVHALGQETQGVLALPLYVDNMALYYNIGLLEENEIFDVPTNWQRFQEDVMKITKIDKTNNVIVAGAALGTTENVIRPTDILITLMMQTGVQMFDKANTYATFNRSIRPEDEYNAGLEALRFYVDFADPNKKVYTWNVGQSPALEMFKQGKLAYLFGYAYNLAEIRNSKVNFGVAAMPSPQEAVGNLTVANYWVETVAKKSKYQDQAWHFLNWLSRPENLLKLQNSGNRLSPLKEHQALAVDPYLKVFASQAPQALSWYHGANAPKAEEALMTMMGDAAAGKGELEAVLNTAAQQVTQTLK